MAAGCVDLVVCCLLHRGAALLLPRSDSHTCSERLAQLWVVAGLRATLLGLFSVIQASGRDRAVLQRYGATVCLLGPVYESGLSVLLGTQPENWSGSLSSPGKTILATAAAAFACLFWEATFPESHGETCPTSNGEKRREEKAMFMRVIRYSKPDAPFLCGAFVFLALAVVCKCLLPNQQAIYELRLCNNTFRGSSDT